jgi:metal-dependent amidase/aminoacylase/carboxypeptidase family protein
MPNPTSRVGLCLLLLAPLTLPVLAAPPVDEMAAQLEELREDLIELRRDLHRHPEISGQEERTAKVLAERLEKLGLEVTTGVGGHGIVAVLVGGKPGGVVGFRADMDATLSMMPDPITEIASVTPGVRHICGHDVHLAVGIGVAEALATLKADLPGTVKFLFQPAEENATGAKAMVAEGALDTPVPEAIFTVHTYPMPVGQLGAVEGVTLVGRDFATVRIEGDGDRKAASKAIAETLTAATTLELPATFPEMAAMPLPAGDFALVQVLRSSPEGVTAQVTVPGESSRKKARADIENRLAALELEGIDLALDYQPKGMAGVYSDPELVRASYDAIRAALGDDGLVADAPGGGPIFSEDFGSFLEEIPGAMFWLGVANPKKGISGMPHAPDHAVDEAAIEVGAKAMAAVVWDFLERGATTRAAGP